MKKEVISIGGRGYGKSMAYKQASDLINKVKKEAYESIVKTAERFSRPGITFSEEQKQQIKNFLKMDKHPTTTSFNLANASSQDLHQMIQSGNLPSFLNSFQRNRITELYNSGKTFDAIRKIQALIEAQMTKPGKTTL